MPQSCASERRTAWIFCHPGGTSLVLASLVMTAEDTDDQASLRSQRPTAAAIAFVCAMPIELRPLRRRLRLRKSGLGYAGRIGDRKVIAVVTGMGTTLARAGTVRLLDAVEVEWVIVVGITGAIENETPIGTLVLPETRHRRRRRISVPSHAAPARQGRRGDVDHRRTAPRPGGTRRATGPGGDIARHGDGSRRGGVRGARRAVVGGACSQRPGRRRQCGRRRFRPQPPGRHRESLRPSPAIWPDIRALCPDFRGWPEGRGWRPSGRPTPPSVPSRREVEQRRAGLEVQRD